MATEPDPQWDPNIFVIEATGRTNTHIRGFHGHGGETEGVICVIAHPNESPNFPDTARIVVGSPAKSMLIPGPLPDLGGFCCSVEAMERFIKVAQQAVDAVRAGKAAGR